MKTCGKWMLCGVLGGFVAALILAAPAGVVQADPKIHVGPPPPPPAESKPSQTFDYKHEIKKVAKDRKPVIALLRPGDTMELKDYLPFGRADVIVTQNENVAVIRAGNADAPNFLPPQVRAFLTRELLQTGEFVVVERERILEIARELALAKTQAVNPDTAPRPGRLIGVHYIIEGSYFPVAGLPPDDPALDPVKREIKKRRLAIDPRNACIMYLTAYKVETGEVKAVACGADLQPLVAVKRAVEDLVDQLGDIVEPIKVVKVNPETGLALLDVGSDSGVKPGDLFTVGAAKAEVTQVQPLSCTAKVLGDDKAAVKEGQEAKPAASATPKDEKAVPAPETPPAPAPKSGG